MKKSLNARFTRLRFIASVVILAWFKGNPNEPNFTTIKGYRVHSFLNLSHWIQTLL